MVRHSRDQVRRTGELDAERCERLLHTVDLIHFEIEHGRACARAWLGHTQHQPDAAGVEERQAGWRLKQEPNAQAIAIELDRAIKALHADSDLTDGREAGEAASNHGASRWKEHIRNLPA